MHSRFWILSILLELLELGYDINLLSLDNREIHCRFCFKNSVVGRSKILLDNDIFGDF